MEEMLKLPPDLKKEDACTVRVFWPVAVDPDDPDASAVGRLIRRYIGPTEPGDEVWTNEVAVGPTTDTFTAEQRFMSYSDPEMLVTYQEGEAEFDRSGQFVELRFACPRFIRLGALEDGFNITVDECGDGAGVMVGRALMWAGLQMLRRPHQAQRLATEEFAPDVPDLNHLQEDNQRA
jgi:hypothetical protein